MKLEDLKKELLPYHISMFERCDEWWLASNNPGAALMIVKVSASRTPQIIHHPEEVLAPEALAARSKRQSQIEAAYLCHCRKKFPVLMNALNKYLDDTMAVGGDHVCVVCGNTLEYSDAGDVQQCNDVDCLRVMIFNAVEDTEEVEGC